MILDQDTLAEMDPPLSPKSEEGVAPTELETPEADQDNAGFEGNAQLEASSQIGPGESHSRMDPEETYRTSNFFKVNTHLLSSELMRSILFAFHLLYEEADQAKLAKQNSTTAQHQASTVEESLPWDFIYPKTKDGILQYNASGKYIVKLFWLGSWRKICVDDRIPVDIDGRPLVVTSPYPQEVWPSILSKALIKVYLLLLNSPSLQARAIVKMVGVSLAILMY